MQIIYTNGTNIDFISLCHELDEYLNKIAGGEENRAQYIPYNTLDDIHDVWIAYLDDTPVGCAAYKYYSAGVAEIKRVFVKKEYRNRGISKILMNELERCAGIKGYHSLILESGNPLIEAMNLYRKIGFKIINNYGQYEDMPGSVCMQKNIK